MNLLDVNDLEGIQKRIAELERENAALREDKARLDWLLGRNSVIVSDAGTPRLALLHYKVTRADIDLARNPTP